MLAIDRRFDRNRIIFKVKNIHNRYSRKKRKHNKLSISFSKTNADNIKTNIVMFTIIMYNGKRMYA